MRTKEQLLEQNIIMDEEEPVENTDKFTLSKPVCKTPGKPRRGGRKRKVLWVDLSFLAFVAS